MARSIPTSTPCGRLLHPRESSQLVSRPALRVTRTIPVRGCDPLCRGVAEAYRDTPLQRTLHVPAVPGLAGSMIMCSVPRGPGVAKGRVWPYAPTTLECDGR